MEGITRKAFRLVSSDQLPTGKQAGKDRHLLQRNFRFQFINQALGPTWTNNPNRYDDS